ncbi:MAG: SpoIIE family protein phosphatase [Fretibacterium sp.]|nr:SpoIIE family protein phosphatase [Fretibacterium sp.]
MTARFRSNLTVQILTGVVVVFATISGIVAYIGYHEFTFAIAKQYEESAWRTARTAALSLTSEYISQSGEMNEDEKRRYRLLLNEWQRLADTQDTMFIYAIRPVEDYHKICFLLEVVQKGSDFAPYSPGMIRPTTNEEYRRAYIDLCENGLDHAVIVRDKGDSETGNHITVLIPIHDKDGKTAAILCVQRQMDKLSVARMTYVRHVLTAMTALMLGALFLYGWYLKRRLLNPIQMIAREALRFARENTHPSAPLGEKITSSDEIGQLARTIDRMETEIRDYIENLTRFTKEKEQIRAEMKVATQIQADMLPREFPPFPDRKEFALFATMAPAKEVGGDFYDFFLIDDDHLALVIADVSGKGVPAALFMVVSKTLIKNRASMAVSDGGGDSLLSSSEILADVNNCLCDGNKSSFFVTVWLGILEISTGKVVCSNAGHEYPAIRRADGAWELMKAKHSPAVATMEWVKFREEEFVLFPGDSLYLYTDGVVEATNVERKFFGTDRMIDALNRHADEPVEELLPSMRHEVDAFVGDAPQFDDITMLALRYFGMEGKKLDELTVEAETGNLHKILDFLAGHLKEHACPARTQRQIQVAAEEIFVNIANYAYVPGTGSATVRFGIETGMAVITFIDSGIPYNPLAKPDPDLTLPAQKRPIGGLGIYMVKKTMDSVAYEHKDGQNIFTMRKAI